MHVLKRTFFHATWEQHSVSFSFVSFSCHDGVVLKGVCFCVRICQSRLTQTVASSVTGRIRCTKVTHRSAEAQAAVKTIDNQMHFFQVWLGVRVVVHE